MDAVAAQLRELHAKANVGVVIGGGNIWRGKFADGAGVDMRLAHSVGMAATVINAALLGARLKLLDVPVRTLSAVPCSAELGEPISASAIESAFKAGEIVLFAGGTGAPFFTTDTGAALRAVQIGAKLILAGKDGVDGVYDSDPKKNPKAKFIPKLSLTEALSRNLGVMDATAFAMCEEHKLTIVVFDAGGKNALLDAYLGKGKHTLVVP